MSARKHGRPLTVAQDPDHAGVTHPRAPHSPRLAAARPAQQSLRGVLSFCNARQMTAPEAYITFRPGLFRDNGEVTDESTTAFLADYMREFCVHIERVLTVIPRP